MDTELGIAVDGAAADQHWDEIIGVITERGITAVLANGLTDRGLEALTRAKEITRLTIGGTQVTDDGMWHLPRMSQFEELNLCGPKCRITDRGLEALLNLRELRRFTIA